MATKSILKDVRITDKNLARKFVETLDRAEKYKDREISRKCTEITGDKVRKFFDEM